MSARPITRRSSRAGFTLTEVIVASAISTLVLAGMIGVFLSVSRYWRSIELRMDADREVNLAMTRMVYGVDGQLGVRAASAISVAITPDGEGGWSVAFLTGGSIPQTNSVTYVADDETLIFDPGGQVIGRDVTSATVMQRGNMLDIALEVEKTLNDEVAARAISTTVYFRNL